MGLPQDFQAGVWKRAPLDRERYDPFYVIDLFDQFTNFDTTSSTGSWVSTQATTGTAAISTSVPGAILLDAGATTAAQGIQVQRTKSAFIPAANKSLWFETTVTLTATTPPVTKAVLFVGLAESDTTIFSAGSQTTANHIGWRIATGGNLTLTFASNKASTETTAAAATLAPATAIKLGFYYDGVADTVQQYVNGVATGSAIATTYIPKVAVYPSFAALSDGTDRPNLIVQGYRVMQLR